jgi:hypothetical protein
MITFPVGFQADELEVRSCFREKRRSGQMTVDMIDLALRGSQIWIAMR